MIFANRGRDHEDGGDGADLWALSRFDVEFIGDPNGDELTGGNGHDRFRVRDGEVDLVHCGEGSDHVLADQFDAGRQRLRARADRRDVTSLDQVDDGDENRAEPGTDDDGLAGWYGRARPCGSPRPSLRTSASRPRSWRPTSRASASRSRRSWTRARASSTST